MRTAQVANYDLASEVSDALHRAVGHLKKPCAAIAERTGRSPAAAKKWLGKKNAPGLAEAIELAREYDEVWDAICRLANRAPATITQTEHDAAIEALRILTERR